jgi:hypothetical protein
MMNKNQHKNVTFAFKASMPAKINQNQHPIATSTPLQ